MNTVCGNCGASVIEGSAACPVCGEPLFNLQGEPNRAQYGAPQMGTGGQGYGGPPQGSGKKKVFAIIGALGCLGVLAIAGIAGFLIYIGAQQNKNSNRIEYNFNVSPSPRSSPSPYATIPPPPNINMPGGGSGSRTVSGGVLNAKAISKPAPVYPPVAKAVKASGTVVVQVTVDESGQVISAKAVSGHPLLQAAATQAAYQAQFTPTKLNGQPVKVTGVLTYEFTAQ